MNGLLTYELLIAEKVEGIVIPDMADAIWGRIEAALEAEMPVREQPFYKKPAVWVVSAAVIAIIIALFLLGDKKQTTPPVTPTILPKRDTVKMQEVKPPDKTKPIIQKKNKPVKDTSNYTLPVVKAADSLWLAPPPEPVKPPVEIKPASKRYGVKVSDSDYRFNIKPKQ